MATQAENTDKKVGYLDLLKEAQQKFADTWNETTGKLVDKALGQDTVAGKANDIVVEMLKEQKQIFDELIGQKDVKAALETSPDLLRKLVEAQTKFGRKWVELYQHESGKYLENAPLQLKQYNEQATETYQKWEKWVHESIAPKEDGSDPLAASFQRFSDAYETMQKYWDGVLDSIKDGIYSKEEFRRFMPVETYEKITENIMGLQTFENFKKNSKEINESFTNYIERMRKEIADGADRAVKTSIEGAHKGTENLVNFSIDLASRMQDTYTPFVKLVTQGNEQVVVEQLEEAREAFHVYNDKATNLQLKVYEASKEGMVNTVDSFWKTYQTEGTLPKFDEFAAKWMDDVKAQVKEVLDSKEYKALQDEFQKAEVKVKESMQKVVDETTKGMPFAKTNEVEALKHEIEALKAELAGLKTSETEEETSAKPAAKKTTAKKAAV